MTDRLEIEQVIEILTKACNNRCIHKKFRPAVEDAVFYMEKYKGTLTSYWTDNRNGTFICANCKTQRSKSTFCPECGRRMIKLK